MPFINKVSNIQYSSHGLSLPVYVTLMCDAAVATMMVAEGIIHKEEMKFIPDQIVMKRMRRISDNCLKMINKGSELDDFAELANIIKDATDTYIELLDFEKQNYLE